MPELVAPAAAVHRSFVAAMEEFRAEGHGGPDDHSMIGRELREYGGRWDDPDVFAGYAALLRAQAHEDGPLPDGFVPHTTLWLVDGSEYFGRIAIRHRLTPALRELGGHIGYEVRRSARRRGHASAMLRAALPIANGLGIDPALLTCEQDNTASRKVIEKHGGVLADRLGTRLRYLLPTSTSA
ncbi:Predicted acetyltransferase [Mycobacterium tuberculosis]|nr:Predicted acetyltransferase [Mycobacterium tuberculosis]